MAGSTDIGIGDFMPLGLLQLIVSMDFNKYVGSSGMYWGRTLYFWRSLIDTTVTL